MSEDIYQTQMKNNSYSFSRAAADVQEFLGSGRLSGKTACNVALIFEEMATNVLKYSYDDSGEHFLDIRIEITDSCVIMTLVDDGHEFDPTKRSAPDISVGIGERQLGGLGIFLAAKLSESMEYCRTKGKNRLKIIIKR